MDSLHFSVAYWTWTSVFHTHSRKRAVAAVEWTIGHQNKEKCSAVTTARYLIEGRPIFSLTSTSFGWSKMSEPHFRWLHWQLANNHWEVPICHPVNMEINSMATYHYMQWVTLPSIDTSRSMGLTSHWCHQPEQIFNDFTRLRSNDTLTKLSADTSLQEM